MDEQNREGEETEVPLSLQKKCMLNPQMKCFINPLKGQLLLLLRGPKDLILVLQWKLPKASFEQLFILIGLYLFSFFKKKKLNDNGMLTTSNNIDPWDKFLLWLCLWAYSLTRLLSGRAYPIKLCIRIHFLDFFLVELFNLTSSSSLFF